MKTPQRKAMPRNGEKEKPAEIISIFGSATIALNSYFFAYSVKTDMVPLIFSLLPAGTMLNCQQREPERHSRRQWAFASWFLCVGSAGCYKMHPGPPMQTWLPQCPATSVLTAPSASSICSAHWPEIQWAAASPCILAGSFVAQYLQ